MVNYYISEFLRQGDQIGITESRTRTNADEHTHAFFDLIIPRSGGGRQTVDGRELEWRQGTAIFVDRGVSHGLRPAGEITYTELIIGSDFFESAADAEAFRRIFYTDTDYTPEVKLSEEETAILDTILRALEQENTTRTGDYRALLRGWVRLLSLYLSRALERERSELQNRDPLYILSVTLEYVDKHFTESISQEELAERFRYNSAYFSRMFKKHRGMNLSDYITGKRIDLACELLTTTELSAEQISERVGYRSKPQFYNTFVRIKGVTPRQYRVENKKNT